MSKVAVTSLVDNCIEFSLPEGEPFLISDAWVLVAKVLLKMTSGTIFVGINV